MNSYLAKNQILSHLSSEALSTKKDRHISVSSIDEQDQFFNKKAFEELYISDVSEISITLNLGRFPKN